MTTTINTTQMKMVRLDDEVHKRLTELGKYGESLSDIVGRILDEVDECRKRSKK